MSADESRALLADVPIFAELSSRSLHKLADLCVAQRFDAGEALIEQNDTGLGLFLVVEGEVEVFFDDGERQESLAVLGVGQVVGEMSLIDDRPRSASVVARRPTRTLLLSRTGFRKLVAKEPEIAWCFVPVLVERLREAQTQAFAAEAELARMRRPTASGEPGPVDARSMESEPVEHSTRPMPDVWSDPEAQPATPDAGEPDHSPGNGGRPSSSRVRSLLETQHAVGRAGLALAEESVGVFGQMLDTLSDEVGLDSDRTTAEVLRSMPAGTAKAWVAAFREAGKSPRRVYEAFRHPSRARSDHD